MIRHAIRRLVRARTFTLAAVATLALGIGGAAAVFTLVDRVLLRPLPFDHADQLVDVSHTLVVSGPLHVDQSDATYLLYRRENRVFSEMGAYRAMAMNVATSTSAASSNATAVRLRAVRATASLFHVLRVPAERGRWFGDDEDQPGAPPVAVISHRLWQERFGGDAGVLQRRIVVDGVPRQIIGVAPPDFQFPDDGARLWIPLQLDPARTKSAAFDYHVVARLRDGASLAAATANLLPLLPRVPQVFPGRLTAGAITATHMAPVIRPLRDVVVGDVGRVLWIVFGAVALLLALACANVTNLFLARAESRHRELAVRAALGAVHRQMLAELLSEAVLVAGAGGALGLGSAMLGLRVLRTLGAAAVIPRLSEVHVDAMVFAVTVAITTVAALVVSAIPLLRLNTASLAASLVASGRTTAGARSRHRVRRALVATQVALALVLLSGAGLFVRSFARLRAVDPGFEADHALTFRVALPEISYPGTGNVASLVTRGLAAIEAMPGVSAVGVITRLPLDAEGLQDSAVYVEDHPLRPGTIPDLHHIDLASPGYFGAMGIPLLAGRLFEPPEPNGQPAQGPPEVVVSAAFAARYWPGGPAAAIGRRVRMNPIDPWHTIVGVVGSVRGDGLEQPPADEVYAPLVTFDVMRRPWAPRNLAIVARTSGDASALAPLIRRALAALDPTLPPYRMMPADDLLRAATARTTFTILLLSAAALVATLLGAFGIYGVISYLMSLRTREIGIRLALGADAGRVRRLVVRQALTDAGIGVVLGLVMALLLARSLGAVVTNVSPSDPAALGGAAAVLLLTAAAASWLPARRASMLDPSIALRTE